MGISCHQRRAKHAAFTLIELLVVIAIIALLISILLPALGRARKGSWMAASLSNLSQIGRAEGGYVNDYKGYQPFFINWGEIDNRAVWSGQGVRIPTDAVSLYFAEWSAFGKNCDAFWSTNPEGDWDVPASERPLNQYLGAGGYEAPNTANNRLPSSPELRPKTELAVCRDPSDKASYFRQYERMSASPLSTYDDVGTSYQFQALWLYQRQQETGEIVLGGIYRWGMNRLRLADNFQPSRMVYATDTAGTVVMADKRTVRTPLRNGYGDLDTSNMLFFDGHVKYLKAFPLSGVAGEIFDANGMPFPPYSNEGYQTVF